jgi:hypothetical protein
MIQMPLLHVPTLWCDNVNALALAFNPVYHARTKHIEVDYHFVHEKVVNRDIAVKFISTGDQIADIFTKGLSSSRFAYLWSKLMVVVVPPIHLQWAVNITRPVANYDDKSTHATSLDHVASSKVIASQDSSHKGKQYLSSQPPCNTLISEREDLTPCGTLTSERKDPMPCATLTCS